MNDEWRQTRARRFAVIMLLLSAFPLNSDTPDSWKGSKRIENGVLIIENPIEPIHKEFMKIDDYLSIGKSEGPEEYIFSYIFSIAVDKENNIYALDSMANRVKVFNKDGVYLRSFGRKGQGPGELEYPINMLCLNGTDIIINNNGRGIIQSYSLDGVLVKEIKVPILVSNKYVDIDSKGNLYSLIPSLRLGFEQIIKIPPPYDKYEILVTKRAEKEYAVPPDQLRYAIYKRNKLLWGITDKYELNIADENGKIIQKIIKRSRPIKLTDQYKKRYRDSLPASMRDGAVEFKSDFPPFDFFFADGSGNIFVKTYEKLKGKDEYIFDVFDTEGRYLTRISMPIGDEISTLQGKYIKVDDKIYTYLFNDEGSPIIRVFRTER
jgi:hypothetical protein